MSRVSAAYAPLEISTLDIQASTFSARAQECRQEAERLLVVAMRLEMMAAAVNDEVASSIDRTVSGVLGGGQ